MIFDLNYFLRLHQNLNLLLLLHLDLLDLLPSNLLLQDFLRCQILLMFDFLLNLQQLVCNAHLLWFGYFVDSFVLDCCLCIVVLLLDLYHLPLALLLIGIACHFLLLLLLVLFCLCCLLLLFVGMFVLLLCSRRWMFRFAWRCRLCCLSCCLLLFVHLFLVLLLRFGLLGLFLSSLLLLGCFWCIRYHIVLLIDMPIMFHNMLLYYLNHFH